MSPDGGRVHSTVKQAVKLHAVQADAEGKHALSITLKQMCQRASMPSQSMWHIKLYFDVSCCLFHSKTVPSALTSFPKIKYNSSGPQVYKVEADIIKESYHLSL